MHSDLCHVGWIFHMHSSMRESLLVIFTHRNSILFLGDIIIWLYSRWVDMTCGSFPVLNPSLVLVSPEVLCYGIIFCRTMHSVRRLGFCNGNLRWHLIRYLPCRRDVQSHDGLTGRETQDPIHLALYSRSWRWYAIHLGTLICVILHFGILHVLWQGSCMMQ